MNTKDNLMILGKDRRSLEKEGFEDDEVEELGEYVLGDHSFYMRQDLTTALSMCRQIHESLHAHTLSLKDPILSKDLKLHVSKLKKIHQKLERVIDGLKVED